MSTPNPPRGVYVHADEVSGAVRSAEQIVPAVLAVTGPLRSVVDVGGGSGAWLRAFQQSGVEQVQLYDCAAAGDDLLVDRSNFLAVDLNASVPPPGRYDLAVSVECAEHLRPERSAALVEWLTAAADVVVFSAAIPCQGGKGHINLQSQDYWAESFARHGFTRHDVLRPAIIHSPTISWWYRQNLFLFAKSAVDVPVPDRPFIPPDFYLVHQSIMDRPGVKSTTRQLRKALSGALRSKFGR